MPCCSSHQITLIAQQAQHWLLLGPFGARKLILPLENVALSGSVSTG